MHDPGILLDLKCNWDMLTEDWKGIFAKHLKIKGAISPDAIEDITQITELDCSETNITDLTPLLCMPQLEKLDISSTRISNFTPLQQLPNLRYLSAVFCYIDNTRVFSKLTHLEVLDISYNYADEINLNGIRPLKNLREFYVNACPETTLLDLLSLNKLNILSLYFSKIRKEEVELFKMVRPNCYVLF